MKDVAIPIDPFLEALDYPETTDRNKALATQDGLAARPENKPVLLNKAGPRLIKLLRLLQPNNHDFAYSILKKVSSTDFGERSYKDWEAWLSNSSSSRMVDR